MIKYLSKSTSMSLRQIEQVFIQINIIYKTIQSKLSYIHLAIIMLFVILKIKDPEKYELLKKQELKENDLFNSLIDKEKKVNEEYTIKIFIKAIILATSKTNEQLDRIIEEENEILNKIPENNQNKRHEKSYLIELLNGTFNNSHSYRLNEAIKTVVRKVEFSDKFNFN
jgi:hypothetical protein